MKTNIICITLLTLFLLIAVIAGYRWYVQWRESRTAAEGFREIQAMVTEPDTPKKPEQDAATDPVQTPTPKTAYETYEGLYKQNPHFLGWIRIDGTAVDYPIMYAPNQPDFYLRRDFYGNSSRHGVPYLEELCAPDMSINLIVYGHNMKDGTMFHDLLYYADKSFWESHQTIRFDTMEEFGTYRVMLVFLYDAEWDEFKYHRYTDMDEADFEEFLEECRKRSLYNTDVTAEYGDELLTLSTCEYSHENGRFVVVAKRIREED